MCNGSLICTNLCCLFNGFLVHYTMTFQTSVFKSQLQLLTEHTLLSCAFAEKQICCSNKMSDLCVPVVAAGSPEWLGL